MGKVFIVYASQTGNTEIITDIVEAKLKELSHEVVVKSFDFDEIHIDTLEDYDAILVGTYTWDDGELPYEAEDFYIDMESMEMNNYIVGVYGSADSFYDTYGGAIDLFWNHAKSLGAMMAEDPLKIDLEPNKEDEARIGAFCQSLSDAIKKKNRTVA